MRRFFIEKENIIGEAALLFEEERNHLVNVLRQKEGDEVILICSDGLDYYAKVDKIEKKTVALRIIKVAQNDREPKSEVHLFQGVAKGEKLDLIMQKFTELGGHSLHPFLSKYSISSEKNIKSERLNKITKEAVKQCQRSNAVNVFDLISFSEMLILLKNFDLVLFAYEKESERGIREVFASAKGNSKIAIIVGGEGGFSPEESEEIVKEGAHSISLGKRILRLETASIALTSVVMYELKELG